MLTRVANMKGCPNPLLNLMEAPPTRTCWSGPPWIVPFIFREKGEFTNPPREAKRERERERSQPAEVKVGFSAPFRLLPLTRESSNEPEPVVHLEEVVGVPQPPATIGRVVVVLQQHKQLQ